MGINRCQFWLNLRSFFQKIKNLKFGYLHGAAIGHLALEADISYIKSKGDIGITVWITTKEIANVELLNLIAQKLTIVRNPFLRKILLPIVKITRNSKFDGNAVVNDFTSHVQDYSEVSFPLLKDTGDQLRKLLIAMKLSPTQSYICLIVRDELHSLQKVSLESAANTMYRNSNIDDYEMAIKFYVESGFNVIRMGRIAMPTQLKIPGFFDYSNSELRSDLNDLIILSNCAFVLSTLSGIDEIASLFRKTVYLANYLPIGFYRLSKLRPLLMPKGLQDSISGKPLTLDEIVTRGLWQANSTDLYFKAGVRIVDCEKNSLKDFAVETLNNYLGYGREKNSSTESKLQEFFAFTSKVPVHLTGKVPEVSKLWMNYEYSNS